MEDIPLPPLDRTQRAAEAQRIMSEPIVEEAFTVMEREFKELWASSSSKDAEGREEAYRMMWACRRLKVFFQHILDEGKLHQWELQQLKRGQI
jgi:hypothetical protein